MSTMKKGPAETWNEEPVEIEARAASPADPRRYRSTSGAELVMFQDSEGNWYFTIIGAGMTLGPTIRIESSTNKGVHAAAAMLWDAMGETS